MHIVLLVLLLACVSSRSSGAADGVRRAIVVMTDVADPVCALAKDTCLLRQAELVARAEAGDDPARALFRRVTDRCEKVMDACGTIRDAQLEAAKLLDEGRLEAAELEIDRARAALEGTTARDGGAP